MASEDRDGQLIQRYDVFLCFRPLRNKYYPHEKIKIGNFTEMLCDALRRNRFKTFMDVPGFDRGDNTSIYILKALEVSRISIVVLSNDFVASPYCLDELVHVLDRVKTKNQLIFTFYYCISTLESLIDSCLIDHKKRFGSEKVQIWESALIQVQKMPGSYVGPLDEDRESSINWIVKWVTNNLPSYHVFLSFSEKDTRYSFTGHLRETLDREGFKTFMKDKGWEDGDNQSSQSAIEKSRISIIVLSENYAYSSSCLDELVTILDIMKIKKQLVWPVFYKADPSDVRHLRKSYATAMAQHENKFGKDSHKVKTWRSALIEVASLKGWHLKFGYEYDLIQQIVETMIKI